MTTRPSSPRSTTSDRYPNHRISPNPHWRGNSMTFVFDKNYRNDEQVRPYMEAFLAVYTEVEAAGNGTAYNDSFRGLIPAIAGDDEDTAIYLLQTLRRLDQLAVQIEEFLADGGEEVTTLDKVRRGTVVHVGFYMGGTGWTQWDEAR